MTTNYTLSRSLQALLVLLSVTMMSPSMAAKVGGVTLEESIAVDDVTLFYNGAGLRKKLFIKLYVGSLYTERALNGSDAQSIMQADQPMLIQLNILSDLLTRDKLVKALEEGFEKSTGGNIGPVEDEINTMIDAMSAPVRPGEVYQILYRPLSGTEIIAGGEVLATIQGLPFKQALFGIWISDAPAQKSLKEAMLGG